MKKSSSFKFIQYSYNILMTTIRLIASKQYWFFFHSWSRETLCCLPCKCLMYLRNCFFFIFTSNGMYSFNLKNVWFLSSSLMFLKYLHRVIPVVISNDKLYSTLAFLDLFKKIIVRSIYQSFSCELFCQLKILSNF